MQRGMGCHSVYKGVSESSRKMELKENLILVQKLKKGKGKGKKERKGGKKEERKEGWKETNSCRVSSIVGALCDLCQDLSEYLSN